MLRRILLGQGQGIFYMLYTEYYAVLSLARLCPALTIIGQAYPNPLGPHACQRIFTALWSMQIWPDSGRECLTVEVDFGANCAGFVTWRSKNTKYLEQECFLSPTQAAIL